MLSPTVATGGHRRGLSAKRCAVAVSSHLFLLLASAVAAAGETLSYTLVENYLDGDFFDKFNFWTEKDPSHGAVEYIGPYKQAKSEGLAKMEDGEAYMGVDYRVPLTEGMGRRSVRVESKNTYNSGLFIATFSHTPTGCATWPAYWMYGEDENHPWPSWGELDIIETIHAQTSSSANLHTLERCEQSQSDSAFRGKWASNSWTNCEVQDDGNGMNMGCPQLAMDMLGKEANANEQGVGTWATEIAPGQGMVRIWIWPKGSEPKDVVEKRPTPSSWGTPYHFFHIKSPDCGNHPLKNMRIVFNIDLCGDLASRSFENACEAIPESKGLTCEAFVAEHPYHFKDAYWKIAALDVYELQETTPARPEAAPTTTTLASTSTKTKTATTTTTTVTETTSTSISTSTTTSTSTITATTSTKKNNSDAKRKSKDKDKEKEEQEEEHDQEENSTNTTTTEDSSDKSTSTDTETSTTTGTLTLTSSTTSTSTTSTATTTSTTATNTTTTATTSTTTTFTTTTITLTVSTTWTSSTTSTTSTTTSSTNTTTSTTGTTSTTSSTTSTISTSTTTSTTSSTNTTTSMTETQTTTTMTTSSTTTSTTTITATQSRPNAITVHVDLDGADAFTYQCRGSGPSENWHFEMAAWCCLHERIGCRSKEAMMAALIAERGSTSTTATTTTTKTSTTRTYSTTSWTKTTSTTRRTTSTTKTKTTKKKPNNKKATKATKKKDHHSDRDDDDDEDDDDENDEDEANATSSSSSPLVLTDSPKRHKHGKHGKHGADREVSDASGLVAVTERIDGQSSQAESRLQPGRPWLLIIIASILVPLALGGALAMALRARSTPKVSTLRSWLFPASCPSACQDQGWTQVPREVPLRQPEDEDDEPRSAELFELISPSSSLEPSRAHEVYSRSSRGPLLSPRSRAFFEGTCDLEEGERRRLLL